MTDIVANYPSLFSHKGTPVRFLVELKSGDRFVLEPLRYGAGGIVLNSSIANKYLPNSAVQGSFTLLGHDASLLKEYKLQSNDSICYIQPFVIYPNGSIWDGRIYEGQEDEVGLLVWSWELAHRLKLPSKNKIFGFDKPWPEVPTTVAFLADDSTIQVCGCRHIHHACSTCDFTSKLF